MDPKPKAPVKQTIWRGVLWAAIAMAVAAGAVQAIQEERAAAPLPLGSPAPALRLPQRGGGELDLKRLDGQVALVSFWASWCGPCVREMPLLRELEQTYRDQGVRLVTVNLDDPDDREEEVADFFAKKGGEPPIVLWPDEPTVHAWNAHRLPTLYIVGRDGRIAAGHTSLASRETLVREIEAAIAR